MISEAALNWEALRVVLNDDFKIYARLAAAADHGAEGNAQRERYAAMMEQVNKTLRSMDAIESAPQLPGLAEHTAAAQDKIIEASRTIPAGDAEAGKVYELEIDGIGTYGPGTDVTAASCDTITKAAQ